MIRSLQQLALTFLGFLLSTHAFSSQIISHQGARVVPRVSPIVLKPMSNSPIMRRTFPKIFMTDGSSEADETETQTSGDSNRRKSDNVEGQITKTLLLTVPLFCKFLVVLLLKFATDLIVYPLLFLYRLAGIVKRKFFGLFGKVGFMRGKTNGES